MSFRKSVITALVSAGALCTALAANAFDGQQFLHEAKISLDQARQLALAAVPGGSIAEQELEHEKGGSGLRYSFVIKHAQGEREVGIDAVTGKLLESSVEGAHSD
ncbi:MAG: PepSY domain-containing protein [Burkholderiales bacterium]|nr:PepSY domain-containing protein [Burkholderiales bacterium]MDE2397388.1 PepSY domain-containing protein [Burkholderiales bacterium]MDE2453654.1 PepSY domain-containing protein [Burkholderiales bacterium]